MEKQEQQIVPRGANEVMNPALAYSLDDVERMADYVAKSQLFGVKTREQAVCLMLLCQAENMHPMRAVQEFDIIQGRATRKAVSALARFQASGGAVTWHESTDTAAQAEFSHPAGGANIARWTIEDARRAGLANKDNWRAYPRAMLRARVMADGVRQTYPACLFGFAVTEELTDGNRPAFEPVEVEQLPSALGAAIHPEAKVVPTMGEQAPPSQEPARRRGRPPGSTNKPKVAEVAEQTPLPIPPAPPEAAPPAPRSRDEVIASLEKQMVAEGVMATDLQAFAQAKNIPGAEESVTSWATPLLSRLDKNFLQVVEFLDEREKAQPQQPEQ